jgi:short-subunit dehydrogenase
MERDGIDILINNAGQGCVAPVAEVTMKKMRETFEVNVFGLIAMVSTRLSSSLLRFSSRMIAIAGASCHASHDQSPVWNKYAVITSTIHPLELIEYYFHSRQYRFNGSLLSNPMEWSL